MPSPAAYDGEAAEKPAASRVPCLATLALLVMGVSATPFAVGVVGSVIDWEPPSLLVSARQHRAKT